MKTDMNPQAITRRLRQTSELRRLCLKLGRNSFIKLKKSSKDLANKTHARAQLNPNRWDST
jgi:hypothetical protein